MGKNFLIQGNICGERVRLGRAMQKPPMTQEDLAREINLMGMEMTKLMVSRIEKNQRHVCDAELLMLSRALGKSSRIICTAPLYINKEKSMFKKAYKVEAVDTTAAGDSYTGALAVALSQDKNIEDAMDFASKVGALSVLKEGAQSSLPTLEDVENFRG